MQVRSIVPAHTTITRPAIKCLAWFSCGLNLYGFDWQALTSGAALQALAAVNPLRKNCKSSCSAVQTLMSLMSSWQQAFGHGSRVFGLAFHPHSPNMIASASEDETVRVWGRDAGSGDWQQVRHQELCMISCRSPLVHNRDYFSTCLVLLHVAS